MKPNHPRETVVLAALCAAVLANAIAYGAVLPLLPVIAEQVGAGPFELGLLYAMYPLSLFITVIPLGVLSDRAGRRPVILLGTVLLIVTSLGFAASAEYWQFACFRFLQGISDAAVWVSAMPLLAEVGDPKTLGRRSGWMMTFFGLGVIIGPAVGATGSTAATYGSVAAFTVVVLAAVGWALRGLAEPRRETWRVMRGLRGLLSNPSVAVAGLAILAYGYVFGALEPTLPPFMYGTFSVALIGAYLAALNAVFTFTQPLIGRLTDRFGEIRFIYASIVTLVFLMPVFVLTRNPVAWLIMLPALGLGQAAAATPSLSLLNRGVGDAQRGLASSLYNILFAVGALAGPVVVGAVVEGAGYLAGMLSISAVCTVVLVTIWGRARGPDG